MFTIIAAVLALGATFVAANLLVPIFIAELAYLTFTPAVISQTLKVGLVVVLIAVVF